jgi:hypothetical protein
VENHRKILPPSDPPKGAVAASGFKLEPVASPNPCLEPGFDPGVVRPASEQESEQESEHQSMMKAPDA